MTFLARFSIKTRLIALVGVLTLLTLVSTLFVARAFSDTSNRASSGEHASQSSNLLSSAYESWQTDDAQSNMYVSLLALKDTSKADMIETTWQDAQAGYASAANSLQELAALVTDPADQATVATLAADLRAYDQFSQQVRAAGVAGDVLKAVTVMTVDNLDASEKLATDFVAFRDRLTKTVDAENAGVSDSAQSGTTTAWMLFGVSTTIGVAFAFVLILSILRPLRASIAMLGHIGAGRFEERMAVRGSDELAQVGTALNEAAQSLGDAEAADLAAKQREREQREREDAMRGEAGKVRERIAESSRTLAAAAEELQVVSEQMGANSAETSSQVGVVSQATAEVNRSVESVSSAAEQMSASIQEIAKNATEAANVASRAVEAARRTSDTVNRLGASSTEIGEVVKVITAIAEQTNLLALNATIEAARAGEAGKGFAVVANEVKELAKGTAEATEDISAKIEAIQTDTAESVESIQSILGIIDQIAHFQQTIAAAVEEQAATTTEISRAVHEASRGSNEIMHNMSSVSSASESTASGAHDTQQAARELARMAEGLQVLVDQFRI